MFDDSTPIAAPFSRRSCLRAGAALGLSLPSLLHARRSAGGVLPAKTRSVVVLFLSGGPSQLDMWDLKPLAPAEIRGEFQPIDTNVAGIQVSEHLPRMARLADKYAIVRSMSHDEGDHLRAGYLSMTGGPMNRPIVQATGMERGDRPHAGAIVAQALGGRNADGSRSSRPASVPPFVMIPEFISPVGVPRPGQHGGFLGAAFDPYLIDSDPNLPDYSPGAVAPIADVSRSRLQGRRELLASVDRLGVDRLASPLANDDEAYLDYAGRALEMIGSTAAQRAFDLSDESAATRDRYGRHIFGQSTLVARRLVEAGVRLVQVNFIRHDRGKGGQGYDSHSVPPSPGHFAWAKQELLPPTDAAFSSLVEDLADRGLLDETLVVMLGEFGRSPKINNYGGRDHWPQCYSAVLAGGGIRGGVVHGSSDKIAAAPTSDPTTPQDLLATMHHLLGVDPHSLIHDRQARPWPIADGRILREWL